MVILSLEDEFRLKLSASLLFPRITTLLQISYAKQANVIGLDLKVLLIKNQSEGH